jgi:competence protein ComEC
VVLHLSWRDISFLLTGDIEREEEYELLYRGCTLRSTILKVGHHGSKSSSTPRFLAAVTPQVAVVSAGEDNPFGHPHEEVMNRLEGMVGPGHIYITSENGTVTFTTDGERLWVDAIPKS